MGSSSNTNMEASRERTTLKNPTMEAGVVREWLDGVQSGYGDRFTPALEEYGVENLQDLATLATTDKDELDKIFTDAGAKKMQLLNIHKGIELLTSSVPSPAAWDAAWDALLPELEEMGFLDTNSNRQFVVEHKGDLKNTVAALVRHERTKFQK